MSKNFLIVFSNHLIIVQVIEFMLQLNYYLIEKNGKISGDEFKLFCDELNDIAESNLKEDSLVNGDFN